MPPGRVAPGPWTTGALGLLALFVASTAIIGADCLWAVAGGDAIRRAGGVLDSVAFAAAPTAGWPPVLTLAQLGLSVAYAPAGIVGLGILQLCAGLLSWVMLTAAARIRGATDAGTAVTLLLLAVGTLAAWGVVRLQVLSLLPFSGVVLILIRQHERATRGVWLLPAIIAVWGNLHGAVLLGVAVIGAYLLGSRLRGRPRETVAVGLATLAAVFANPALTRTVEYYQGVFGNAAARSRTNLWAPLSLSQPLDILLGAAGVVMVGLAWRARPAIWEWLAVTGLTIATLGTARSGLWLLMVLVPVAACGASRSILPGRPRRPFRSTLGRPVGVSLLVLAMLLLAVRGDALAPAEPALVRHVTDLARGRVVLASEPLCESLAVSGARVWVCNPVDAFDRGDQEAFVAFLEGRGDYGAAIAAADLIVVRAAHPLASGAPAGFRASPAPSGWIIWERS